VPIIIVKDMMKQPVSVQMATSNCSLLHRTAGDTERRYHLRYYKTGMCVHDTDNRGYCVKNGPHCAFAHGNTDLRPPVYDIKEMQAIENGEVEDNRTGPNSLDKERSLLNDDPQWLKTPYVLANYKTEPCKKPPRLCRQGYACPQYHNNKDRRRSPKKFKYRSTPCPAVKTADEWGDPVNCDSGDNCQYCHTRTEQQFHPEIYKSTKCNDIQNTSYCPRGAFCAFAHIEQEGLEAGADLGFGDMMNQNTDSQSDSQSDRSSNSGEMLDLGWPEKSKAPGSHLKNNQCMEPLNTTPLKNSVTHSSSIPTSPTYKLRTPSGDSVAIKNKLMAIGNNLEDLSINDLYESKSRKSSGFSDGEKSRNCSGNSISQGLMSSGILSSNPVNIPGQDTFLDRNESLLLGGRTSDLGDSAAANGGGYLAGLNNTLGFQGGLFDFGPQNSNNSIKDAEISRLREELGAARAKLSSWEESMIQARQACEAWKKEAAMAKQKADMATKEKEAALAKLNTLQKENEQLSGGPLLHGIRRVSDLPSLPPQVLKTLEWQLRKDIGEVERVARQQADQQQIWLANNRVMENVMPDWSLGLNLQPLYTTMGQQ